MLRLHGKKIVHDLLITSPNRTNQILCVDKNIFYEKKILRKFILTLCNFFVLRDESHFRLRVAYLLLMGTN